jgi:RNA polymerase sigma-70 factor (ECF subfamily)
MVFRRRPTPADRLAGDGSARAPADGSGGGGGPRSRERSEAGDEAFAAEALSYIDSLYGTAIRLTRRGADAEDLVQDTYLKAFRSSAQFQRGTNLKAWLFTILHNTFRNMRRHEGRNPIDVDSEIVEQAAGSAAHEHSPEQLLTRASLDADLQAALDALPDAFRQAVWLRDVEELSYSDIAKVLGVPIGTVMSRISRGRRALYDRLAVQSDESVEGRRRVAEGARRGAGGAQG